MDHNSFESPSGALTTPLMDAERALGATIKATGMARGPIPKRLGARAGSFSSRTTASTMATSAMRTRAGQRYVFRHNTVTVDATRRPAEGYDVQPRPHLRTRSKHAGDGGLQILRNLAHAPARNMEFRINGGTLLDPGNTITQYRDESHHLDYTRESNATYPYGTPTLG